MNIFSRWSFIIIIITTFLRIFFVDIIFLFIIWIFYAFFIGLFLGFFLTWFNLVIMFWLLIVIFYFRICRWINFVFSLRCFFWFGEIIIIFYFFLFEFFFFFIIESIRFIHLTPFNNMTVIKNWICFFSFTVTFYIFIGVWFFF